MNKDNNSSIVSQAISAMSGGIKRLSRSGITRRASTLELTSSLKMSGSRRRALMRSRDLVCVDAHTPQPTEGVHPAARVARKLTELPLAKVVRRQHQYARRASTAAHLAAKLNENSPFRPAVLQEASVNRGYFGQATAEINARMLACAGKLAPSVEAALVA
jgi:hypothetical protein